MFSTTRAAKATNANEGKNSYHDEYKAQEKSVEELQPGSRHMDQLALCPSHFDRTPLLQWKNDGSTQKSYQIE